MEASYVTRTGPPPGATFSAFERFYRENYATVVRIAHGYGNVKRPALRRFGLLCALRLTSLIGVVS